MADISTVGEIVNFLAIATYNRPMTKIAEQAGLSEHAIEKAEQYNGDFLE